MLSRRGKIFLSSPSPSLTTLEGPKLKARELHSRPGTWTLDQVPSLRAQATSLWDQAPSFWNQAPSLWERTILFWDQAISLWGQDTSFWDEAPSLWETGTRHSHSWTRHPHSGTRVSGVSFKSASLFPLKNAELRLSQKNSATDGRTDGRTDMTSHRDAWSYLKSNQMI